MKTFEYEGNSLNGGPKLSVGNEVVFQSDSPEDIREYCEKNEISTVLFDGDGNGSIVSIPVEWIGDGEKLDGSSRVLDLIK